jgi:hypothetical protein
LDFAAPGEGRTESQARDLPLGFQQVISYPAARERVFANAPKLSALYGVGRKKVRIADAETTIAQKGYTPEGVSSVGHRTPLPVLIDETLARVEIVYGLRARRTPSSLSHIGPPRVIFTVKKRLMPRRVCGFSL